MINYIRQEQFCKCFSSLSYIRRISVHRKVAASRSSVSHQMASVFLSNSINLFTNFVLGGRRDHHVQFKVANEEAFYNVYMPIFNIWVIV